MTPMLSRFEGYNVNSYKFHPMNVDTVSSGKIITMRMPSNALVDLKSFSFWFDAKAVKVGGGGRLPALSNLIDRMEITVGGQNLSGGMNGYNVVRHI